jgi:hypothetical protein
LNGAGAPIPPSRQDGKANAATAIVGGEVAQQTDQEGRATQDRPPTGVDGRNQEHAQRDDCHQRAYELGAAQSRWEQNVHSTENGKKQDQIKNSHVDHRRVDAGADQDSVHPVENRWISTSEITLGRSHHRCLCRRLTLAGRAHVGLVRVTRGRQQPRRHLGGVSRRRLAHVRPNAVRTPDADEMNILVRRRTHRRGDCPGTQGDQKADRAHHREPTAGHATQFRHVPPAVQPQIHSAGV